MKLAEALRPFGPSLIAFVGAGGKTSALFGLARDLRDQGEAVLATTTTHLLDPRTEASRPAGEVLFRPEMEGPSKGGPVPAGRPGLTILFARETDPPGKVKGLDPSWLPALKRTWPYVLVEADGSRRLPVKAPGPAEPVLPPDPGLVVGVVGLDCLGQPMAGPTVHRPDCFQRVTGCAPGAPIAWAHLDALVRHPEGLFKGATGPRVVLFNKADLALFRPSREQLAALEADLVLLCALGTAEGVIVGVRGGRP